MIFKSYQEVLDFINEIISSRYQSWEITEYVKYNPQTNTYTHSDTHSDTFLDDDYNFDRQGGPVEDLRNRILSKK